MAEFGLFYFNQGTSFPGVIIKSLGGATVLVRVWTDDGDRTEIATISDSAGDRVFVKNA